MIIKIIKLFYLSLILGWVVLPQISLAEEFPTSELKIPGRIEGVGTYFEIKDSEYLNITLKSTEEITVVLESIPRMISLEISSSTEATFTNLILEGLEPYKTYYKY